MKCCSWRFCSHQKEVLKEGKVNQPCLSRDFQKLRGDELVPATSQLNHSILCLSAGCVSCTMHSLSAEIGFRTLPTSHMGCPPMTFAGRNEFLTPPGAFTYWGPERDKWMWACLCLFSASPKGFISKRCDDRLGNTELTLRFLQGTLIHGRACGSWLEEVKGRLLLKSRGRCQLEQQKEDAKVLHRRTCYRILSSPKRVWGHCWDLLFEGLWIPWIACCSPENGKSGHLSALSLPMCFF